jgi:hypothetical protein
MIRKGFLGKLSAAWSAGDMPSPKPMRATAAARKGSFFCMVASPDTNRVTSGRCNYAKYNQATTKRVEVSHDMKLRGAHLSGSGLRSRHCNPRVEKKRASLEIVDLPHRAKFCGATSSGLRTSHVTVLPDINADRSSSERRRTRQRSNAQF